MDLSLTLSVAVAAGCGRGAFALAGTDAAPAAGLPPHPLLLRQTQAAPLLRRPQVDARLHRCPYLVSYRSGFASQSGTWSAIPFHCTLGIKSGRVNSKANALAFSETGLKHFYILPA